MHSIDYDYGVCDLVLDMFDKTPGGFLSFEQLRRPTAPPDDNEVFSFLVEEGLLDETRYGYQITRKGRIVIHSGGFKKQHRRERCVFICTIVAAVSGIVAAVASIVSLLI